MLRGIRGAITVKKNSKEEIIEATQRLLKEIVSRNGIKIEDIASIIFSATEDLNAVFPAEAARQMGWEHTALMCTVEISVPDSLPKCIRILMHVNSEKEQNKMLNIYLEDARKLR